jgi:hypothetical protein
MATSMAKQEVDKKMLYGKYQESEDRRHTLRDKAAYKALDIALEDDPLQVINTKTGISTPGAVGIAGILGASLLGYGYMNREQPVQPQTPPAAVAPADSDYEIRFWDKDGNPIEVERVPPELRKKLWEQLSK